MLLTIVCPCVIVVTVKSATDDVAVIVVFLAIALLSLLAGEICAGLWEAKLFVM